MKQLPINVQNLEQLVEENSVYVDKTKLIHRLIQLRRYYFLTRPRRFGKTLLVDTLQGIFQGRKELFRGCYIESTSYSWEKRPVIRLDFAKIASTSTQALTNGIINSLRRIRELHGKPLSPTSCSDLSLQEELSCLIKDLSVENKVVVLIDEYDKPLADNLSKIDIAEANQDVLKVFFETLKALNAYLRFVFITGVSRFAQDSLFAGMNTITDLTMDPAYATLLGYTEAEIRVYFNEHIELIVKERSGEGKPVTEEEVLDEIRDWYHGYRFSSTSESVYNPLSILSFLQYKKPEEYWFETGATSLLVNRIKETPLVLTELANVPRRKKELLNIQNLRELNVQILLWQTGYLTIHKYDEKADLYYLDFPNQEVRGAFFFSLLRQLGIQSNSISSDKDKLKEQLEKKELGAFFGEVNTFFDKVPRYLLDTAGEGFYQALFLMLLEAIGIRVSAEVATKVGRIDLVMETPQITYVVECKLDANLDKALEQIELTKYTVKYRKIDKELVTIGVNFSSQTRAISSWKAVEYLSSGEQISISSE
eukprot:Opistho-1_new@26571